MPCTCYTTLGASLGASVSCSVKWVLLLEVKCKRKQNTQLSGMQCLLYH